MSSNEIFLKISLTKIRLISCFCVSQKSVGGYVYIRRRKFLSKLSKMLINLISLAIIRFVSQLLQVSHGVGATVEESRDAAASLALKALSSLAKEPSRKQQGAAEAADGAAARTLASISAKKKKLRQQHCAHGAGVAKVNH